MALARQNSEAHEPYLKKLSCSGMEVLFYILGKHGVEIFSAKYETQSDLRVDYLVNNKEVLLARIGRFERIVSLTKEK